MKDDKPSAKDELATLGRGVLRTLIRDALVIAVGAAVGAVVVFFFGRHLGFSLWTGALAGALLAGLIFWKAPFDYGRRPGKRDPDD